VGSAAVGPGVAVGAAAEGDAGLREVGAELAVAVDVGLALGLAAGAQPANTASMAMQASILFMCSPPGAMAWIAYARPAIGSIRIDRRPWKEVEIMETVTVVLSVGEDQVEAFEQGFRQQELPIWQDFLDRGILVRASLSRLDISSRPVEKATQYLVVAVFATGEGHHLHDQDPRFHAWNEAADAFQVDEPLAFGGETIIHVDA
jgi:hypothetical protein